MIKVGEEPAAVDVLVAVVEDHGPRVHVHEAGGHGGYERRGEHSGPRATAANP